MARQSSTHALARGVALLTVAAAMCLVGPVDAAPKARPGWTSQPLVFVDDADTYSGTRTFIDVAPSGRSVIFYAKGPRHNSSFSLWLARGPYADGSFDHQRIDAEDKKISGFGSLAVGPKGRAHVSYISGVFADQGILKYAISGRDGWKVETADPVKAAGATAITLDSRNHPVIAYSKVIYGLWLATRGPSGWATSPVIEDERIWALDVAVDADDNPRIAYIVTPTQIDVKDFEVRLATFDGTSWSTETVGYVSEGGIEFGVELLIDAEGNEDIVFPVWSPEPGLAHAYRTTGGWQLDTIDVGNLWQPTLTRDVSGGLHVTYYNATKGALKYAALVDGEWITQTVADNKSPSIRIGRESSIAVDDGGIARIAYYVGNQFEGTYLRYATSDAPVPPSRRERGSPVLGPTSAWTTETPLGNR